MSKMSWSNLWSNLLYIMGQDFKCSIHIIFFRSYIFKVNVVILNNGCCVLLQTLSLFFFLSSFSQLIFFCLVCLLVWLLICQLLRSYVQFVLNPYFFFLGQYEGIFTWNCSLYVNNDISDLHHTKSTRIV